MNDDITIDDPLATEETTTDDVTVEKTVGSVDGISLVTLTLTTAADAPASVRVVDAIPPDVSGDRVGLPPENRDAWTVTEDRRIAFEATVAPDETVNGRYALDTTDEAELAALTGPPTVEVTPAVEPPTPAGSSTAVPATESAFTFRGNGADATVETDGAGDADVAAPDAGSDGDADADAGTAEDPLAGVDGEAPTGDDPFGDPGTDAESAEDPFGGVDAFDGSPSPADESAADAVSGDVDAGEESVVDRLVDELADRELDDAEREVLADRLLPDREEGADTTSGSVEARLRYVQNTVTDLDAYREALEEFLDDRGTAPDVVADLEASLDEVREDLADLDDSLATLDDRVDDVASSVADDLRDELHDVRTSAAHAEDVARVESELEATRTDLTDELAALRGDVESLRETVEANRAVRQALEGAVSGDD
ncbi:MAG: hypothetical protein ABEJ70_05900 [Halobacteriaceae archaeon]